MSKTKAMAVAATAAAIKHAARARRQKKDKRNEEQRRRDIANGIRELLSQAQTALDYVESRDYEDAESEFQFVSDDADFVMSEIESLVQYKASLSVPR